MSRGRSMMCASAGETAGVIVSTISPDRVTPGTHQPYSSVPLVNQKGGSRAWVGPGAGCRQPPTPDIAGAGSWARARGSSPVSALNAAGICRRLGTPSFCRSASECAFAVRGEMPSFVATSSFEQPCAINLTICTLALGEAGRVCSRSSWPRTLRPRRGRPIGRREYSAGGAETATKLLRGRGGSPPRAPPASARRRAAAGRTRRADACASSPGRPSRS